MAMRRLRSTVITAVLSTVVLHGQTSKQPKPFAIEETTIEQIQAAFKLGKLTARQLVQGYLDRISAYDQKGPNLNAIITLNPEALEEADRLDALSKSRGS